MGSLERRRRLSALGRSRTTAAAERNRRCARSFVRRRQPVAWHDARVLSRRRPVLTRRCGDRLEDRRRFLRIENCLRIDAHEAAYGAPHGVVVRGARADTPERRAQYEVPGQRFAFVRAASRRAGLAMLALDTYGWSGRADDRGFALGHSLLRGTTWPDPSADEGEHRFAWASCRPRTVRLTRRSNARGCASRPSPPCACSTVATPRTGRRLQTCRRR